LLEAEGQQYLEMQRLGLFIIIENAAQDVDSLLQAAVKEALTGHQLLVVSEHCGKVKGSEWGRIQY
jgi:hypothetical protein